MTGDATQELTQLRFGMEAMEEPVPPMSVRPVRPTLRSKLKFLRPKAMARSGLGTVGVAPPDHTPIHSAARFSSA